MSNFPDGVCDIKMGRILFVLTALHAVFLTGTHGQAQRTVGPVQCLTDPIDDALTAKFVSKLKGDDINHVYGCMIDPLGSECTYSACNFTTFVAGGETYLTLESVIDISVADPAADGSNQNACGFIVVQDPTLGKGYRFRIGLRKEPGFLWGIDNDYVYTCYEQQALSTVLTTSIAVQHDDLVVQQSVQNPEVNMYVLRETNNGYERSSTCQTGENMRLEIVMVQEQYENYLVPWGLYARNTRVAPFSDMSNSNSLTTANGCEVDPNVLELDDGFARDATLSTLANGGTRVTSVYRSGVFQCKRYLRFSSNELHFDTSINFCVGEYEGDNNCIDFCTASTRRRRAASADFNVQELRVSVTIVDAEETEKSEGLDSVLIIVIAAISVVVCCALLASILICVCLRHRRSRDDKSDVSSYVSSDRKLPIH